MLDAAGVERAVLAGASMGAHTALRFALRHPERVAALGLITPAFDPGSPFATDLANRYLRFGSSPRGAQTLIMAAKVTALIEGRLNVSFDDIQKAALPALRHRLLVNFEGEAEGTTTDQIVEDILGAA